jgi:hypothetical protein
MNATNDDPLKKGGGEPEAGRSVREIFRTK